MSTPAIILNSSPVARVVVPLPVEAGVDPAGIGARRRAMNSGTVVAGTEGLSTMMLGAASTGAIGAMSRKNTKLSFGQRLALIRTPETDPHWRSV